MVDSLISSTVAGQQLDIKDVWKLASIDVKFSSGLSSNLFNERESGGDIDDVF